MKCLFATLLSNIKTSRMILIFTDFKHFCIQHNLIVEDIVDHMKYLGRNMWCGASKEATKVKKSNNQMILNDEMNKKVIKQQIQ